MKKMIMALILSNFGFMGIVHANSEDYYYRTVLTCQVNNFEIKALDIIYDTSDLNGWTGVLFYYESGKYEILGIDGNDYQAMPNKSVILKDLDGKQVILSKSVTGKYSITLKTGTDSSQTIGIYCQKNEF